jgi:sec-independent protein translocase protein TatC
MPEAAAELEEARGEELRAMGFLEHLEELRRRVIAALISVTVGFAVCWFFVEKIFALIQRPIIEALQRHKLAEQLVYTSPTEPFNVYLKVALIAGLFLASPAVFYQLWMFISPGLYRNEERYVLPFMFFAVGLFLAGGWFGYVIAYPAALDFLIGFGEQFAPMITISEYTNMFLTVMIGLGIIFEMPVVIFFLALMGVVTAGFLWRNLRYAILVIFIVAAILTPTSDIMNLMIFAAPMIALYVLSIGLAWLVSPARRRARAKARA